MPQVPQSPQTNKAISHTAGDESLDAVRRVREVEPELVRSRDRDERLPEVDLAVVEEIHQQRGVEQGAARGKKYITSLGGLLIFAFTGIAFQKLGPTV